MGENIIRKYLSVSKRAHKTLEVYAKHSQSTLKSSVEHLIDLGLRYEREAHNRPENEKIFDKRLPEFNYTVGRSVRTYLAVSPRMYEKVKSYVDKKKLSLVEGTWRLLSIGMQYSLGGDPRNDPEFKLAMEIGKTIEDHLRNKHGLPVDKYMTSDSQSDLEERVIRMLQHQARSVTDRGYQKTEISDTQINYIKIMDAHYGTILQGAQQRIEKLEKKNELLEREIVRRDKLYKQRGTDSVDKADLQSQGDESGGHIQNEWPSLE